MRITDWLTYSDIEHLRRLNRFYGTGGEKVHSKHELIVSLLQVMGRKPPLRRNMEQLNRAEQRFLELIVLDPTPAFTMEELKAKAAAAAEDEDENARDLITGAVSRGWLFPGYSPQTQNLYHMPSDLRERMLDLLCEPFAGDVTSTPPEVYRDEQGQMVADLVHFLDFLRGDIVRLTNEGAIWRQQQKQLFKTFFIPEEPITEKSPRFGFGRKYHLYPDRFSLLYDYAWYHGYILEDEEGYLCLTDKGIGKISDTLDEGQSIFRFWIRLYRKPVPHLPVVIRWIGLLGAKGWIGVDTIKSAVLSWIPPFYYETPDSLFVKILKMLSHLGVIRIGSGHGRDLLTLTESGREWLAGASAFRERVIEEGFIPD